MLDITPIPAFQDNYIWAMHNAAGHCVVVDPGDASVVEEFLLAHSLQLTAILITHHHWDHTGGLEQLCAARNVPVYGPKNPSINGLTQTLGEADSVLLSDFNLHFQILEVPGHTLDHIAYYSEETNILFCGDTLFHGGCGRLFEGTPQQMLVSLNKLAALPAQTRVYCTHEYTLANLTFAHAVEPNNSVLAETLREVAAQREQQQITLPSRIDVQKQINPFLRSSESEVIRTAEARGANGQDPSSVFQTIRSWKDNF
ncbi:MAG: hydroxyacylglutathione hydrolase [Oceanococcus sp.]